MTIPRIGNKIVRVKSSQSVPNAEKIIPVQNQVPEINENVSDFEEGSIEDILGNFDDASSEQNTLEPKKTVNEAEVKESVPAAKNIQPSDEEYSIKAFTNDYMKRLHGEVLPMLAQYDPERKQRLFLAILCFSLCWLGALIVFFMVSGDTGNIVAGLVGLGGFAWYTLKKRFEEKIKRKVMPVLMRAVPDFYWQLQSPITEDEIVDSKIFSCGKDTKKVFDDCFLGRYRGVEISIAESSISRNRSIVFSGAIIKIKMNKDFEGTTVIRPKKEVDIKTVYDLRAVRFQKVDLEDVEFNKTYDVYSNDQVEARYLLTTAFMERFQNINLAFKTKVAYCSFSGKYVYIAPYCKNDLFSICSLVKNVADEAQFVKLFNEITSILSLVDHFKLDKKLGL